MISILAPPLFKVDGREHGWELTFFERLCMPHTVFITFTNIFSFYFHGWAWGRHYGPVLSRGKGGSERGRDLRSQNSYVVELACSQVCWNPNLWSHSAPWGLLSILITQLGHWPFFPRKAKQREISLQTLNLSESDFWHPTCTRPLKFVAERSLALSHIK